MKTARDFLFNQDISPNELDAAQISHIIAAINAARKEAIEECAEIASQWDNIPNSKKIRKLIDELK